MGRKKVAKVSIEMVTPKMAERLLKLNTKNRVLNQQKVAKMVRDFKNGQVVLTSDAIGVDVENVLTNGGHRLTAIMRSKIAIPLLVARNLPTKARDMVDTGTPRNFGNSLTMNNLCCTRDEQGKVNRTGNYSKMIASASSYIIIHQINSFNSVEGVGTLLTNSEVVDFVRKNERELMTSAKFITEQTKRVGWVQKPHLLFVYQMHKLFGEERANEFVEIVCGNAISSDPMTCPAQILKNKLIENQAKTRNKLRTKDLIGLYVDASNKFMKNLEVKSIRSKASKSEPNNIKFVGEINALASEFFNSIDYNLHKVQMNRTKSTTEKA